jgi:hypothetical protein
LASPFFEACEGPIGGLRLPLNAWVALEHANITTLEQLKAVADRIEGIRGIGPRTADAVKAELERLATREAFQARLVAVRRRNYNL